MTSRVVSLTLTVLALVAPHQSVAAQERSPQGRSPQQPPRWKAHDLTRPQPTVVAPGSALGQPPGDAIVLFNGRDLSQWTSGDSGAAGWAIRDGYMETKPGAGAIQTRRGFGDVQLHVEWASPATPTGKGQGRGNSGVIFMGRYEVQVLDSHGNTTYPDGQAGAVYGQYPPLVNASRSPGQWQSYDVVFRRPRFGANGTVTSPARMTVFHNGVLVQDNVELWGETIWLQYRPYAKHADALPLVLQDHDNPVKYRNVWLRELPDPSGIRDLGESVARTTLAPAALGEYAGTYASADGQKVWITQRSGGLQVEVFNRGRPLALVPQGRDQFDFARTAGRVEFVRTVGQPLRLRLNVAENTKEMTKQP